MNNSSHRITIRFTSLQYGELAKVQRRTHYSMSRFIRVVLLERAPRILDRATIDSYKEMLRLTAAISGNINQIAKVHNAFAKTKVHFSQSTQQVIRETLQLMQQWDKYKKLVIQPPAAYSTEA